MRWTFAFGCLLTLVLAIMSFVAQKEICAVLAVMVVGLSVFPAVIIFARLWLKSSGALGPIKAKLVAMESGVKSPDA